MVDYCEYTRDFNYKDKSKLWTSSKNTNVYIQESINSNDSLYEKRALFQNKHNQIMNYKYFYIYTIHSKEIVHKLNIILLSNPDHLSYIKKLEFCDFLITYLSKSLHWSINKDTIEKSFEFIFKVFFPGNNGCNIKMLIKNNNYKRSSYKFCVNTYQCEKYYKKKKCFYDHLPTEKLMNDIVNIYFSLQETNKDFKEINKSLNTILFVISSVYNETYMHLFMAK